MNIWEQIIVIIEAAAIPANTWVKLIGDTGRSSRYGYAITLHPPPGDDRAFMGSTLIDEFGYKRTVPTADLQPVDVKVIRSWFAQDQQSLDWVNDIEQSGAHLDLNSKRPLSEGRMYRGETEVRMKDLDALFDALSKKGASSDPVLQNAPNPKGGAITCKYAVDPRVWNRWTPNINMAKILAGTDKKDTQHRGQPQGGTVMKRTYGGRIVYAPGKANTDHERMPSAMDRFDVIMVADVSGAEGGPDDPINWPPNRKENMPKIVVTRIAWSPSIGTAEERQGRLADLLSGKAAADVPRRVQPAIPEPAKGANKNLPDPQPVPRIGQNVRAAVGDDDAPSDRTSGAGARNSDFSSFLSKHSAEYEPQLDRSRKQSKNLQRRWNSDKNRWDDEDIDSIFDPANLPRSKM